MLDIKQTIKNYTEKLVYACGLGVMQQVSLLAESLYKAWKGNNHIYLCGNGGSAGNAIHLANDLLYGAGLYNGKGLCVEALSANSAVITCLANDVGYEYIYSEQLKVKAKHNDILIVLSGSGNSPNVVKALEIANEIEMRTFAILGFSGGRCKLLAEVPIHFEIDDMQIAEDLQLIVGHICMQWLSKQKLSNVTQKREKKIDLVHRVSVFEEVI